MSTELVTVTPEQFPALQTASMGGSLAANLGNEQMGAFDFPQWKRSGPESTRWQMGEPGDRVYADALEGIVLYTNVRRNLYASEKFDAQQPIPVCTSWDCKTGIGTPGGACARCPHGVMCGRCRLVRLVLLLQPGCSMPCVFNVSPTSLKTVRNWLLDLAGKGRCYVEVMARFTMFPSVTKGENAGQNVARIKAETIGVLDAKTVEAACVMARQYQEAFAKLNVREDFPETIQC